MSVDQATVLRSWVRQRDAKRFSRLDVSRPEMLPVKAPYTLLVCSGKGGAGKTSVTLNLGLALVEQGLKVALVDASTGLSHLDLLFGRTAYWNLEHVLTGSRGLSVVILSPCENLQLITGLSSALETGVRVPIQRKRMAGELDRHLSDVDVVLIDGTSGQSRLNRQLMNTVDLTFLVTTLETTALADTYALLKSVSSVEHDPKMELIINRSEPSSASASFANLKQTMKLFLRRDIQLAGTIPEDTSVWRAIMSRRPFYFEHPLTPAGAALQQLARRITSTLPRHSSSHPFFERLFS